MTIDTRAFALTFGILWGGCFLLVGLVNLASPTYGLTMLQLAQSVYPLYHGPTGFGSVVLVTLLAFVDGGVGGAALAWLYNAMTRRGAAAD